MSETIRERCKNPKHYPDQIGEGRMPPSSPSSNTGFNTRRRALRQLVASGATTAALGATDALSTKMIETVVNASARRSTRGKTPIS